MKLKAELNGIEYDLTLDSNESRIVADVCGRRYELEIQRSGDESYLFLENGRVFDLRVTPSPSSKQGFEVAVRGNRHLVKVIDPRRLSMDQDSGRHHHGAAEITAPMPGKVVRVLVEAGQEIEAGAGIVVVEAMKMQNEMKSPRAGTVVSINVNTGDTVEAGTLLAVIESI